jgi:hypothetical protein
VVESCPPENRTSARAFLVTGISEVMTAIAPRSAVEGFVDRLEACG